MKRYFYLIMILMMLLFIYLFYIANWRVIHICITMNFDIRIDLPSILICVNNITEIKDVYNNIINIILNITKTRK